MTLGLVTLGEAMVLLLAEQAGPLREATTFRRHIAGAEANVAIGVARLGGGVGWIGRVGHDEFGRAVTFRLRGDGVDLSHVRVDHEAPTGVYFRERRDAGPIAVFYYRSNSAGSRLSPADLDERYIGQARMLHLTGITPALSESCRQTAFDAADIARSAGVTVVLDPNVRLKLWSPEDARRVLRDLACKCDVLLPSADEVELLSDESDPVKGARSLLALGPKLVVVKVGAEGAIAVGRDLPVVGAPALPLSRVVDPVGAGDAFASGFIIGQLRNLSLPETMALAARCGATAVTAHGDHEVLLREEEATNQAPQVDISR